MSLEEYAPRIGLRSSIFDRRTRDFFFYTESTNEFMMEPIGKKCIDKAAPFYSFCKKLFDKISLIL